MAMKKFLLLVDDNKHLLVTLGDYLRFHGFKVETALSAEAAMKQLTSITPDLIVLDISMPGMGGIGFLKEIADPEGKPKYPVLVFTARAAMKDFFGNIDVAGFLDKGSSEQDVLRKINDILSESRRTDSSAKSRSAPEVFLAEGDLEVREAIVKALRTAGMTVDVVENGTQALERAPHTHPDVIVMRDKLAKMPGRSVAALLQVMSDTANIPVLLYENIYGAVEDRAAPQGVTRFLSTNNPDEIVHAVREAVAK